MTKVNTLFGEFDEEALKKLKGYVSEVVFHMHKNDSNNAAIKDIIEAANDELKIPKKIIKRMAKTDHKNSFQTEVAENKEYESLYESMKEIK
jgi:predicted transcriptional regulator